MPVIDLRCPEDPRHLLMKLRLSGEQTHVTENNLMELSCDACKARLRKAGMQISRVLHRYDFLGELIETEVQ